MIEIWCLFSMANDYNQPPNCLVSWWPHPPDLADLKTCIRNEYIAEKVHEQGKYFMPHGGATDYWLECVPEGKKLDRD